MILPPWVYPTAAAALLAIGFAGGWQVQGWRTAARHAAAMEAAQKAFERQLAKQDDIAADYERDRETARVEYITREGKVREIFREIEVPSDCAAPPAIRGLLNEAVDSANEATAQPGG